MSRKVIVVGGGWAGVSAAVSARNAGAEVIVLERTDMLLGTGLVGGIMRNNGRFTATEEMIAMGGGEIFNCIDANCRHKNIEFPGHKHANLYDVSKMEPSILSLLRNKGIEVRLVSRVKEVESNSQGIVSVILDSDEKIAADVFIDATGSAGPMSNCGKHANGCVMCILRCPTFGGRISLADKAGVIELMGKKADGAIGAISGSCKLLVESLSEYIAKKLQDTGVYVAPIPQEVRLEKDSLSIKACQQYSLPEFSDNLVLLDTGHAKLMTAFYPLEDLRKIPGFERARYEDPYSGGRGNSIRYMAIAPRDNALKVEGVGNLFCAGEKTGPLVGHTEAIVTGTLAGYNAVRWAFGEDLLVLSQQTCVGDAISFVNEQVKTADGLSLKYTFSGSVYFSRMRDLGLYTTDVNTIRNRVEEAGLTNVFAKV